MDHEDWPNPLPEGWILKKNAEGKYWAYKEETGQMFETKDKLLHYVNYANTTLSSHINEMNEGPTEGQSGQASEDRSGKQQEEASESAEESWEEASASEEEESEEGEAEEALKEDDCSSDNSIDFSKGIWSIPAVVIEEENPINPFDDTDLAPAGANRATSSNPTGDDEKREKRRKTRKGKQPEQTTEGGRSIGGQGAKKKFQLPPKKCKFPLKRAKNPARKP